MRLRLRMRMRLRLRLRLRLRHRLLHLLRPPLLLRLELGEQALQVVETEHTRPPAPARIRSAVEALGGRRGRHRRAAMRQRHAVTLLRDVRGVLRPLLLLLLPLLPLLLLLLLLLLDEASGLTRKQPLMQRQCLKPHCFAGRWGMGRVAAAVAAGQCGRTDVFVLRLRVWVRWWRVRQR
jgi:hypothetical protein